jgi:hypothetical protein
VLGRPDKHINQGTTASASQTEAEGKTMAGKSWYSTGFSKDSGGGKSDMFTWEPDRVWMPAKDSRDFVFVDDAPLN